MLIARSISLEGAPIPSIVRRIQLDV